MYHQFFLRNDATLSELLLNRSTLKLVPTDSLHSQLRFTVFIRLRRGRKRFCD